MSTPHWNHGIAGQISRDTEDNAPSQRETGALPLPNLQVDPTNTMVGLHGGPIPHHSETWGAYFSTDGGGTGPGFIPVDPKAVLRLVSDPQHSVSGNTHDGWRTLFSLTTGAMRNGSSNSPTYNL